MSMISTDSSFEIAGGVVFESDPVPREGDPVSEVKEESAGSDYETGSEFDDVITGMKYASLAITDDEPNTLINVGKMNPWHIEALKMITGSEEEANKPLTYLLKEYMNLDCDKIISESGMTKGGHFIDTQGYIAHNDEVIVLAYRCTTSLFDWLTNFNTTSSEWEVEEDVAQGYSGFCSGLEGLCCNSNPKPRVHTGFYNNFLCTVPFMKKYIDPLLQPNQPPRRLYVVGHSLGAGVATLAASHFLMEYDWDSLPHSLVGVTAGSPRTALGSFKNMVETELIKKESATMLRVVRNKDVVATVPPKILGFHHLGRLVHIAEDGEITVDSKMSEQDGEEKTVKRAAAAAAQQVPEDDDEEDDGKTSKYAKSVARIPTPFRDHMPDFYMAPMRRYREKLFPKTNDECAACNGDSDTTCTHSQFLIHKKKPPHSP